MAKVILPLEARNTAIMHLPITGNIQLAKQLE
jgi:hypothetical protein